MVGYVVECIASMRGEGTVQVQRREAVYRPFSLSGPSRQPRGKNVGRSSVRTTVHLHYETTSMGTQHNGTLYFYMLPPIAKLFVSCSVGESNPMPANCFKPHHGIAFVERIMTSPLDDCDLALRSWRSCRPCSSTQPYATRAPSAIALSYWHKHSETQGPGDRTIRCPLS